MPALTPADMKKDASSGDYAGTSRVDIFDKKIKDKKPFIIGNSASGQKVIGVKYDKRTETLVYTKQGQRKTFEAPRSKVFKDKDFGGGGGSGGGSSDTALTECLQCFYCAYVFNKKRGPCKSVSTKELMSTEQFAVTDKKLKECLDKGPADWVETDVYIKTANKLWEKFGRKMTKNGNVFFHRGSSFMQNVYAAKKKCHKIDRESGDPQAPGAFNDDKWNPGDIWATTFSSIETPLSESTSNWGELNAQIYKLSQQGKLLGISLKKIGKGAGATSKEFNTPKAQANRQTYQFNNYKYGRTGDFFGSQDIYIDTSEGEIQFRTFSGDKSWQGEIKGGAAAGGKIGGGNVDFYCQQVFKKDIYGGTGSEASFIAKINADPKWPSKMYQFYKKYNSGSKPSKPLLSENEFLELYSEQTANFTHSKAICMMFLETFVRKSKKEKDEFITKLFRYASSDVDQSSYYVKIS